MSRTLAASFRLGDDERLLGQAIQCRDPLLAAAAVRQLIDRCGEQHAVAMAVRNGVACIAGHAFAPPAAPSAPLAELARHHLRVGEDISRRMAELDAIGELLAGHQIPLVALKNGGIARSIFPCPGCNPMGDLDLLVRRSQFRPAHRLLLDFGYALQFRSKRTPSTTPSAAAAAGQRSDLLDYAEATGGAEYMRRDAAGNEHWLELQWRPVAGRWIQPDQEPPGDELIDRSGPIPGSHVRLLAPADNLLQVALHTAKHSYVRAPGFRLHTDVDRIASLAMDDWDSFLRSTRQRSVRTPVYFSLRLAHELLGTPIPDEVLQSLRPPGWRERWIARSLQRVGLFDPDAAKFHPVHFILFCGLLYDDWRGLTRAAFPAPAWMRQRYGCSNWQLPWRYLRRGVDLLVRHENT